MKKTILIAITAVLVMYPLVMVTSPAGIHSSSGKGQPMLSSAPSGLPMIERVAVSDYRLPCRIIGGETVDILVVVRNHANVNLTTDFTVSIYLDEKTFLDRQTVTDTITMGKSKRVHFYEIPIQAGLGAHTLDAYLNDDTDTRQYCTFQVTPLGINNPGEPSPVQILWGQMQATMAEQEVTVTQYGGGEAQMTVSYRPFFFQYFPVWAEVSVAQSPSWLTVSPSQTTFPLQQGKTQADDITLAVSDDVEAGTIGLVELAVEGRTTVLPSLLAVSGDRASFIVEVQT